MCRILVLVVAALAVLVFRALQYDLQHFEMYRDGDVWTNWGKTHSCRPLSFLQPASEKEIVHIINNATELGQRVKVVGAGHSWTNITCDPNGHLLNLDKMNRVLKVSRKRMTVTTQAGITWVELAEVLDRYNLTIPVYPYVPYLTVGGSISTSSHGGGREWGSVSTLVTEMRVVVGNGSVITVSELENPAMFNVQRTGLGLVGVITSVTLRVVPQHLMRRSIYLVPRSSLNARHLMFHKHAHTLIVCFPFTTECAVAAHDPPEPTQLAADPYFDLLLWLDHHVSVKLYILTLVAASHLPWLQTSLLKLMNWLLPHGITKLVGPSHCLLLVGHELPMSTEMEYHVPSDVADQAFRAVLEKLESMDEIRFLGCLAMRPVQGDDIFMSPFFKRESVSIEFQLFNLPHQQRALDAFAQVMETWEGRPHWGKQNHIATGRALRPLYRKWEHFNFLREQADPYKTFFTPYWDELYKNDFWS